MPTSRPSPSSLACDQVNEILARAVDWIFDSAVRTERRRAGRRLVESSFDSGLQNVVCIALCSCSFVSVLW